MFMKDSKPKTDENLCFAFIIFTNFLIYYYWGPYALAFILFSGMNSIGPHPAAAHIIAEHYEFIRGQESYDYLGWMNYINMNVGYHI
jgi:sphingolipid 4-desaturase/C4-monooxygenase